MQRSSWKGQIISAVFCFVFRPVYVTGNQLVLFKIKASPGIWLGYLRWSGIIQMEYNISSGMSRFVVAFFSGPVCSVLLERLGCRATVMLGGVLSGLGMAASSFTHSIGQLYVTAGVITGERNQKFRKLAQAEVPGLNPSWGIFFFFACASRVGFLLQLPAGRDHAGSVFCATPRLRQCRLIYGYGAGLVYASGAGQLPARRAGLEGKLSGFGRRTAQLLRMRRRDAASGADADGDAGGGSRAVARVGLRRDV